MANFYPAIVQGPELNILDNYLQRRQQKLQQDEREFQHGRQQASDVRAEEAGDRAGRADVRATEAFELNKQAQIDKETEALETRLAEAYRGVLDKENAVELIRGINEEAGVKEPPGTSDEDLLEESRNLANLRAPQEDVSGGNVPADIQKLNLARQILTNPDAPAHDTSWANKVVGLNQQEDDRSTERERLAAELEEFENAGELTPAQTVKHKLAWIRAQSLKMDPARAGFANPGVSVEKKQFTAIQKTEIKSTIRKLDTAAGWIDEALDLVGQPYTVGAPAYVKRLTETVEGWFNADAEQPAKDFKRVLVKLKASNWREVVGPGQISSADYFFLGEIFEGLSLWDDPPSTTKGLLDLRDWFAFKRDGNAADAGFAPRAALEELKADPSLKKQFDEWYPNG